MYKAKKILKCTLIVAILVFVVIISYNQYLKMQKKKENVIIITKNIDRTFDFWNDILNGAQLAAEEYGVNLSIRGTTKESDYEKQNEIILEAIEEKPDAIVLAVADYNKTYPAAKQIKEKGIKLVLVDSTLQEDIADSQISTENFQAGIKMGAVIQSLVKANEKIGIVSYVKESSTAMEREMGIRTVLASFGKQIVTTVYGNSEYEESEIVTEKLIEENPDITVIAALNQYSAVGAGRAVTRLGLEDKVKIVGFDNAVEEIKYLEAGVFEAIVIQKPFNMGYLSVENAVKLIRREPVTKEMYSGSVLITRENMYSEMNQKLLFPFKDQ